MSEKQDRQGVRTAMDLERKWQFGKQFAEVMGVATDAQKAVAEIGSSLGDVKEQVSSISRTAEEIRSSVSEVTETTVKLSSDLANVENQIKTIEGKFLYIKYSEYEDGHVMTDAPTESTKYMGTCSTDSTTAPTDHTKYVWCRIRGADGTPGVTGADGRTQYLHIKYSDDGETFTANDGEELGAWIGTLVDFVEEDSTVFTDYTWKKFTVDVDSELETIRTTTYSKAETVETAKGIFSEALKEYVTKSEHEEYKGSFKTNFDICAEGLSAKVLANEDRIKNVDEDLQEKYNTIEKYFTFDINGLTIGKADSPYKIVIDNDDFTIYSGGIIVQTFKADGNSLIPSLTVTNKLNLLGLEITEDTTHINCDY